MSPEPRRAWRHRPFPRAFIACLAAALALAPAPGSAQCKGAPELEARVQRTPTADAYTDLGASFGETGNFACANQAFRAALKLDPTSAKINYFLGFSLYSSGDRQGALGPLGQSAQLDPQALQPRLLMAAILKELNRTHDAEAQWQAALAIDPASPEALDGLSRSLIDDHDYTAAINLLRNAPRNEVLTLDLGSAYGQAGMLDEAATTVRDALAANPASIRLTKALATVYVHQQRYQDATALLRQFLGAHPGDQEAEIQYLSALVLTSDAETARPLGKKLLAEAPHNFQVLYLNGILERVAEEYIPARDHLREAVALNPEDYSARYNLGAALAHLNDPHGAKEQLEKAVALDPSQAEAHFQLASVLRTLGDTPAAQAQLVTYQQLKRSSAARAQADTKAQQARDKLAAGDTAQAVVLYAQAVAATPGNALLQYQYAMALDAAQDAAKERAALQTAVTLDPTFALAQNQLGYVATRGGETALAEASFRRAVAAAPGFTEAWINLAATLASQSRFGEAQQAVGTALKLEPANAQALQLIQQLAAAAAKR